MHSFIPHQVGAQVMGQMLDMYLLNDTQVEENLLKHEPKSPGASIRVWLFSGPILTGLNRCTRPGYQLGQQHDSGKSAAENYSCV